MCTISTIAKNGEPLNFSYIIEEEHGITDYLIYDPNKVIDDYFQLRVEPLNTGKLRVTMMTHNNNENYMAKGIPEAMILEIVKITGCVVQSSPKYGGPGVYQTCRAIKVWERLVKAGKAKKVNDYYETTL